MGFGFKTPAQGAGTMDALGYYIRETLFRHWAEDRQNLEIKWQDNLDAFNAVTEATWKEGEGEGWRSDTRLQIVRTKVLSAWSIIIDLALQAGDIRFSLIPSPYDELQLDTLPPEVQAQVQADIKTMEQLIRQQLGDCNADRQMMRTIMSSAMYGECYGKCYVHDIQRMGYQQVNLLAPYGIEDYNGQFTRWQKTIKDVVQPAWEALSVWDIYRDLETDDLQEGVGIIHRQMTSAYHLRQRVGLPHYFDDAIELAIAEAHEPGSASHSSEDGSTLPPLLRDVKHRFKTVEQLEFWGRVPKTIVEEFERSKGLTGPATMDPASSIDVHEWDGNEIEIMAVMADNNVIRYSRVEPRNRPFFRAVWEMLLDHSNGTGVPDAIKPVGKVLDGMIRAFEDNKKLAGNTILGVKERLIGAWDGKIKPGTKIDIADECDDVRKAIQQVTIQDVGDSLLSGIGLFERLADESAMLPKVLQGEVQEKKKPDTAFEMSQLIQYSSKYLGGVIKNHDEGITEPVVQWFYEYNMDDPDIVEGKGNYIARAMGYASFQDKIMRVQVLQQFLGLVLSSDVLAAEVKIRTVLEAIATAMDLDVQKYLLSDQEKAERQMQQQMMAAQQAEQARQQAMQDEQVKRDMDLQAEHDRELMRSGTAALAAEEAHQRELEIGGTQRPGNGGAAQ